MMAAVHQPTSLLLQFVPAHCPAEPSPEASCSHRNTCQASGLTKGFMSWQEKREALAKRSRHSLLSPLGVVSPQDAYDCNHAP